MRTAVKVFLTAALAFFQLVMTGVVLFAAAAFVFELLGDNDDGTFTPSARRTMIAARQFLCVLAVWLIWLYVTIRALIRMWRKKAEAAPKNEATL
jgi:hypothetical protein